MTQTLTSLDARTIPPRDRHATIFRAFDGLAPGASFALVLDHEPKPLLYQLQNERGGAFEWSVLESGPSVYRVEILRRSTPGSRDVSEFLGWDHDRLDAIFGQVEKDVAAGDFAAALPRFKEFRCGLDRHIALEESILFPVFEQRTGMSGGPTAVMRFEHVEIKGLLAKIGDALESKQKAGFEAAARRLLAVLGDHNEKEEQILYPMTDNVLGDDRARDDLVRKMQAF